ncbi:hypothetical protein ABFB50_07485 [Dehalococcoides sp. THU3]|uniref:hypothetical protein n=1 Tax=Dehalococcoides TaxID=61434 RepID=UPI0032189885
MLLNRKMLNTILQSWKVSIPAAREEELLAIYGKEVITEDGLTLEYSEQDICEQLRKIVRQFENDKKDIKALC